MRLLLLLSLLIGCGVAAANPKYKIGIIDTGLDNSILPVPLKLCESGHFNFGTGKPGINTEAEHGTMVGAIIAYYLQNVDYCAVVMSVEIGAEFGYQTTKAMKKLENMGLTALNLSFTGNQHFFDEFNTLSAIAVSGTRIFVAVGNDNKNLDIVCNYYPACYHIEGLYMVGARKSESNWDKASYSNYGGRIQLWYIGDCPFKGCGGGGTSFAAPRALSDYVLSLDQQ